MRYQTNVCRFRILFMDKTDKTDKTKLLRYCLSSIHRPSPARGGSSLILINNKHGPVKTQKPEKREIHQNLWDTLETRKMQHPQHRKYASI